MKKLLFAIVACVVLCTVTAVAEEFQAEYYEIPYELIKGMDDDCQIASLLGDDGESIYAEIEKKTVDALKNKKDKVNILGLMIPASYTQALELRNIFVEVLRNNPYYGFYVDLSYNFAVYNISGYCSYFEVHYKDYEEGGIEKIQQDIDKATGEIIALLDEDMTDFEKVMTVHDYMVLNYEYDTAVIADPDADVVRDVTIMLTKKGVCMGYSYAFKHVMNELGIECGYVVSEAMNHEWNVVKIDGEWYHIDVTHDDPLFNNKYDMFALVSHKKAFLSSEAIATLGAVGYVLPKGVSARSKKYDDAAWRTNMGAVVTLNGVTYYVDGNNLVDETGKIIHSGIAKSYGIWNGVGSANQVLLYCGLSSYDGKLYFNTENAVYSYDPDSGNITKILDTQGICGMYINGDTLYYGKYVFENRMLVKYAKSAEVDISYMRIDEDLVKDVSDILVTFSVADMTYKQKVAANVYTDDEEDGIVKINIKDVIKMAQIIATKKN